MRTYLILALVTLSTFAAPMNGNDYVHQQQQPETSETRRQYYKPAKQRVKSWASNAYSSLRSRYDEHLAPRVDKCIEKAKCLEEKMGERVDDTFNRILARRKDMSAKMEEMKEKMAGENHRAHARYHHQYNMLKSKYDKLGERLKSGWAKVVNSCKCEESNGEPSSSEDETSDSSWDRYVNETPYKGMGSLNADDLDNEDPSPEERDARVRDWISSQSRTSDQE